MALNQQDLVQVLQASINPKQYKQAAATLKELEQTPGFSLSLLHIVASPEHTHESRLASALCFKNFIKRKWTDESGNHILPESEVKAIKDEVVGLMLSVPSAIQAQLGDAISVIAESDFWERWETLVPDLVSRLSPDNATINNGVLQVAHSIFKRWRPLFKSDALFSEILHVLKNFAEPFFHLLQSTDTAIEANKNNSAALKECFTTIHLSLQIIFDCCCQDLPEQFEDHKDAISSLLNKYIRYDNPLLETDDESEVGPLEFVKAAAFDVLTLFVSKEDEVFGTHVPLWVESSWNLLTTTGLETKYDFMASRALNFLSTVCRNGTHASSFNSEAVLKQVVEGVILPNLSLRDSDVELFEDEPIEYTRRDLEGTENDTRRRAATDFLRQLMEQFQQPVTTVVNNYINLYLQNYSQNKKTNWKSKDTAVYLFCSIAAVGVSTSAKGVKTTNSFVNVIEFFSANVAEDLVSDSSHVILQVDAIKFLYIFRSQMTPQQWQEALPLLVRHLDSANYVVHTYSAIALERTLFLTDEQTLSPVIPPATIAPLSKDLLKRLFTIIEKDSAPEKVQENEFLMKCVMRVLIVIREDILPINDFILTHFINIIRVIRHNPSNPRFYYFLFEAVGALIRFTAPSHPEKLEQSLYPPFAEVLQNDVQEFVPYVFQLFAALLEANPSGSLSDYYKALVQPVLLPALWESKGNVPALVRLLSSLMARGAATNDQIEPILGIFQSLISLPSREIFGFDLLESVITSFPVTALQNYFTPMFSILLTRLIKQHSEAFTLRFVRLYHLMSARQEEGLGADAVVSITDTVTHNVFRELYTSIILAETQKLSRPLDRKIAVISLTKTLAHSQAFVDRYPKGWGYTCEAMLKLMLNPPVPPAADDIIPDQDVDDLSFGVGFTQLNTCRRAPQDPFPQVVDVKAWIGQYLKEADGQNNGRISKFIQERLSSETQQALIAYMRG